MCVCVCVCVCVYVMYHVCCFCNAVDEKLCIYSSQNAVESGMHALISCDSYMDMNARISLCICHDVINTFNSLNRQQSLYSNVTIRKS